MRPAAAARKSKQPVFPRRGALIAPSGSGRSAPLPAPAVATQKDSRNSHAPDDGHGSGSMRRGASASRGRYQSAPPCGHTAALASLRNDSRPEVAFRPAPASRGLESRHRATGIARASRRRTAWCCWRVWRDRRARERNFEFKRQDSPFGNFALRWSFSALGARS